MFDDEYFDEEDEYEYEEYDESDDEAFEWEVEESIYPAPVSLLPPLILLGIGALLIFLLAAIKIPSHAQEELAEPYATLYAEHPGLSPLFTPEIHFWGEQIMLWASQTGLDPNLIATVMQIESCGDPRATSSAGAMGLFQVMPYHFESGENPYLPDTNALRGLNYLKKSLDTAQGNARLAFAGYNGGISVISKSEGAWANETVRYAYWGSGIYTDALQGASKSARLDEWLSRGGASLCAQARANQ